MTPAPAGSGVSGTVTRGTTARRRLRRLDRWLLARHPALLRRPDLLVVDLGIGAQPWTTLELADRVTAVNPRAHVVGLDIEPDRVAVADRHRCPGVEFRVGGFELAGLRPHVVRAANVLRQYDATAADRAWTQLAAGVGTGGIVVDATLDEAGGLGAWVCLDRSGPRTLTLAVALDREPSAVAARLPKALIHANVPGTGVHALLETLDRGWHVHRALGVFGARQRFARTVADLRSAGWPVLDGPPRWRRGEVTLAWSAVSPVAR